MRCGELFESLPALFSTSGAQADSSMVALCLFRQLLQIIERRNILIAGFFEISLSIHKQFWATLSKLPQDIPGQTHS